VAVTTSIGMFIAFLLTLTFYPATIAAGLIATAKSKRALITAGSLGLA